MTFSNVSFGDVTDNFDKKRIPLSAAQREKRQGKYRYYGAQGVIDWIDDYIFDGTYLLIAEDGENLKSKKSNIAQLASGKFWVNNHAHVIQCKKGYDIRYLCYLINLTDLSGYITGSAQPKLSQSSMNAIVLPMPKFEIQKEVADFIEKFDKKIQINEKVNDNLLQQARVLYKDRFVDLKPFDGEIPLDWHIGTVSEIIELHDSKRIPLSSRERSNLAKIYPYYGATSVMDYVDRYLFDGIYLLLGEDGTVVDSKGFPILQYVEGKFWVNNHAHIITGKNGFTVETLYLLFSLTNVQSIVTGAVQPKISQANLNKMSVVIPSEAELSDFNSIVQPIFAQIRNLRAENDRLASTRDILLPRLMSGEIDAANIQL